MRILSALLRMAEEWTARVRAAGGPAHKAKAYTGRQYGSFEGYCAVIGGILEAAGVPGFLGNLDEMRERTGETDQAWADFLERWEREHGGVGVKVGDLWPIFEDNATLAALVGDRGSERAMHIRFGALLKKRVDVVCGGRAIRRAGSRAGSAVYAVEACGSADPRIEDGIFQNDAGKHPPTSPTSTTGEEHGVLDLSETAQENIHQHPPASTTDGRTSTNIHHEEAQHPPCVLNLDAPGKNTTSTMPSDSNGGCGGCSPSHTRTDAPERARLQGTPENIHQHPQHPPSESGEGENGPQTSTTRSTNIHQTPSVPSLELGGQE